LTKAIEILIPGWFTTVQDLGRFDFQHMGVPVSGALDKSSCVVANLLVGNPVNAPLLEITVMGPGFIALKEMDMALTGADMEILVNKLPMPQWETIRLKPGDKIALGQAKKGCRGYLAFGGGIDVPLIMGSASTYFAGKCGGFNGRALKKDDLLEIKEKDLLKKLRCLPFKYRPAFSVPRILRAVAGPQDLFFDHDILFGPGYQVTEKADRMGYRLSGPSIPIRKEMPKSIISEPVMPGSIQIPPDQKIATIISPDLQIVAQSMPGDMIVFEKINLAHAHEINRRERLKIQAIEALFSS